MLDLGSFGKTMVIAGFALFFSPTPGVVPGLVPRADAQSVSLRVRHPPPEPPGAPAQQTPVNSPPAPSSPGASPAPAASSTTPPQPAALPPSLLDKPAQPANIQFARNTLSIHADNSSLNEILRTFSSKSGMQIEGLTGDQRVFGSFGPGTPDEVLAKLLNGTPYDVLMVGDLSNGAPRRLVLSPAHSLAESASASPQLQTSQAANQNDANAEEQTTPMPPNRSVKTPQELFRELQAIRQRQQQQQ